MPITNRHLSCGALALIAFVAACSEKTPIETPVEISFSAHVSGEPFSCDRTYDRIGSTQAQMTPQNLSFYVSNVRLLDAKGKETPIALTPDGLWQNQDVALLDFENASGACNGTEATNSSVHGAAPQGNYSGVRFTLGVPEHLNHEDATLASPPLNYTGLFWGWRLGYIFFRLDMDTSVPAGSTTSPSASGFSVHLGSVGCGDGDAFALPPEAPCTTPNRTDITIENLDIENGSIGVDIGALLAETDITTNTPDTASGCMSFLGDPECFPLLSKFGLPYGGPSEPEQKVFSAQ